ncbi:MAG: YdcF family protein [Opitutaceae bacterium]|nr:YdcF family protein [Opitutaceae bacterium]
MIRLKSIFRRGPRRLRIILSLTLLSTIAFVLFANLRILNIHNNRLYTDVSQIPPRETGLVLGANRVLSDGRPNLHFESRMDATAALYRAGKIKRIIVSGDNGRRTYDEPSMMKESLVAHGVPASAIICDYAGFRTLDSVVRAHTVFGLKDCIIITQRYHNTRALEIARATGLDALGFSAKDVVFRHTVRTEIREVVARTVAVLDLYVWHRQPRLSGPPEPLPPLGS